MLIGESTASRKNFADVQNSSITIFAAASGGMESFDGYNRTIISQYGAFWSRYAER